jgi:radical SAM protein with 4Fe4S-binding SPASM domain
MKVLENFKQQSFTIQQHGKIKIFNSKSYNYIFDTQTGLFIRWGKTKDDDPKYSVYGPEILDIEISTICHGGCPFCYKSNTPNGKNMSLETFKTIFDKFPKTLTQIAFGIGDLHSNPDLWNIMKYCRQKGVIPNITINGQDIKQSDYDSLTKYCGAVAVSLYDFATTYHIIYNLTHEMKQVNIHALLSEETYEKCMQLLKDTQTNPELRHLNAVVFLWLKPKGKRNTYHQLKSKEKFKKLIDYAFEHSISIGFDSCSSAMFLESIKDNPHYKFFEQMVEPCESTLFSYYINVDGIGFPCSFSENTNGYKGVNILKSKDFLEDVWNHKETIKFRKRVIDSEKNNLCRKCTLYNLGCGK